MIKQVLMTLTVATIAIGTLSSAALAGGKHKHFGGWGKHHHFNKGYVSIRINRPYYGHSHRYVSGCYKYKKRYKLTHKRIYWKKYKACRLLAR